MKTYLLIFLIFLPIACMGQMMGLGMQASKSTHDHKLHFNASASLPYHSYLNENFCTIISSGIDYVSGSNVVSGLNLKPIMFATTMSDLFNQKKCTLMLGADAGYNFNFNHGHNGLILTPNIYFDYEMFYIKIGYDYNTFYNEGQFFVKVGVGIGWGLLKR